MDEKEIHHELDRLREEYPHLMRLLQETPAPLGSDSENASDAEVLEARALGILGLRAARERRPVFEGQATFSGEGLSALVEAVARASAAEDETVDGLAGEVAGLRSSQLTADEVRVIAAKVLAGAVGSIAALAAIVVAIVKLVS
jgi:hypothetical protein